MSSIHRTCSIKGCNKNIKYVKLQMCIMHYTRWIKHGDPLYQSRNYHGLSHTWVWVIWQNIKKRTLDTNNWAYQFYGARGITICERWKNSVSDFYEDIGDRPDPKLTLDRIDGDGNYSCGKCAECIKNGWSFNVRWATRQVQSWNQKIPKTNTSGFRGVIKSPYGKWDAQIGYIDDNGKKHNQRMGRYETPEEAAIAYDIAAIFFRGSEAKTNIL